ncbi:alkaline shock response membrane anchor protein AmaP [Paenibacillus sp. IB182496]|uniref:Alkaline shock response membrane anchor protein AmaP n=1 Tax=Paenibacillus sabuli TaxID=2772509 RepID=A0A927BX05_9BACL|nr:alkaline shock response membrane anchor protein AmaP [Paenibacillus sabuli]MBD2847295.1 alkaline shock response membrane anchor protein AmaP [Paenibacillus sabuli]
MIKIMDRLLLFLYSLLVGAAAVVAISIGAGWVTKRMAGNSIDQLYDGSPWIPATVIIVAVVVLLLSLRFFYVTIRRDSASVPSIDQRTDFGDIRISMETVENLALKAAAKQRGVKDLRARIRVADAGLEIVLRAVVDGETPIPALTEDIQRAVKEHVEDITGIPVSLVTVFVANIIQSQTFKSRVE